MPDTMSVWLGVMLWVNPLSRRGSHLIMDTVYRTHTFLQENRTFQSCTVKDFNFFFTFLNFFFLGNSVYC